MDDKILKEIMENPNADPNLLARGLGWATGSYAFYSGLLQDILIRKPKVWNTIRERIDVKSDNRADKLYEQTEDGITETNYRLKLKSLEKSISTLRTLIAIRSNEERHSKF